MYLSSTNHVNKGVRCCPKVREGTQHNTTTTYSKYSPEFSIQKRKKNRRGNQHFISSYICHHLIFTSQQDIPVSTQPLIQAVRVMYTPLEGVGDQRIISSLFPKPVKTPPLKLIHAAAALLLLVLWSTTCQHLQPFGTRNMHNTLQDRLLILLHSIHRPPRTTRCAVPRTFRDSIAWRIHAVYVISIIAAITQDCPFIILGLEAASAQARWAVPA